MKQYVGDDGRARHAAGTAPAPTAATCQIGKWKQHIVADDFGDIDRRIGEKIEHLRALVAWWQANVSVRHATGRDEKNADRRSFLKLADAEALTGFRQQQISRIRARIREGKITAP